jgi:hypothetical protein
VRGPEKVNAQTPRQDPLAESPPERLPNNDGEPRLNKRQSDEFFAADRAANKILDELDMMDKLPDGGDEARRAELFAELSIHGAVVSRYAALLSEMCEDASEEERSKLNRADRRALEARVRKRRSAKAQAANATGRKS